MAIMALGVGVLNANSQDFMTVYDSIYNVTLSENNIPQELDDDAESDYQSYANITTPAAYRSFLEQAQGFGFAFLRYRPRGYDNRVVEQELLWNSHSLTDLATNTPMWWLVSGLNNNATGAYRGTLRSSEVEAHARDMRSGGVVALSGSNRTFTSRLRTRYVMRGERGWNFAASLTGAGGPSLTTKGVWAKDFGVWANVSKDFGTTITTPTEDIKSQSLELSLLFAPSQRAMQGASTKEAFALTDDNLYNPYWGYQGSRRRNARIRTGAMPVAMLAHGLRFKNGGSLRTSLMASVGSRSTTALNWQNAPNPQPDYYRNMPAFESSESGGQMLAELWRSDPSVSQVNYQFLYDFNGYNGGEASYIIESRVRDISLGQIAVQFRTPLGHKSRTWLTVNAAYRNQREKNYKILDDLLGATYWMDLDNFLEQEDDLKEFTQSNALNPNHMVKVGDEFGYNYALSLSKTEVTASVDHTVGSLLLTLHLGGQMFNYRREGFYHKENFTPNQSLGKSAVTTLLDYQIGGLAQYRFGGRANITLELDYKSKNPNPRNLYFDPRFHSVVRPDVESYSLFNVSVSGAYRAPGFRLSGAVYLTSQKGGSELLNFYDDLQRLYCHYLMQDMGRKWIGVEIGAEVQLIDNLWLMGMIALSDNRYTDSPRAEEFRTSTLESLLLETVNYGGLHCGLSPENIGSLQISYRPFGWTISASVNMFSSGYVAPTPLRRTARAASELGTLAQQERLPGGVTMDVFAGRTFRLRSSHRIGLYVGLNNLLNRRDIITSGYESTRLNQDSKFYYGLGINGFVNVSYYF